MELREGSASKRGRNRDRDSANRSKRRRGSHSQSTEESVGNEQDDDVLDAGVSKIRSPKNNTTSLSADQNHRRIFTPARPPPFKITEEMIGVTVPRKARSASAKRSHESWVSAGSGGGGGEELSFRQRSNSPGGQSVEPASPSSSNVSVMKKMKGIEAVPKTLKSSSSDIEIEIAELLYGMKTSKNHETSMKLEASVNHHASVSCLSEDVEKKKMEDNDSSTLVLNNSTEELVRIQSEQHADVGCYNGHENGPSEAPKDSGEQKMNSCVGFSDAASADGRSVSHTEESPSCSKLDAEKHDLASTRVMSAIPEANTQRVGKFEIDLMAPPPMVLSPEGDDLSRGDFISSTKAFALDVEMKRENSVKVEKAVKKEKTPENTEEAKMATFNVLKHDLEKPNSDNDIKTNNKLEERDRNKELPTISSNPKTAQSTSMPLSTTESGRPCSLSPIGYKPPLQPVVTTDKITGSLTPQHANFVVSQPHPKRCATHYYIARNIFHQQFTKMKPPVPVAIGSGSLCGTKPNNVNCVPSAESMVVGKQSEKHLPSANHNVAQEKGWATSSNSSLTTAKSSNNANSTDSAHRVQLVLQQGPNSGSTGNLVHGPAFLYPPGQHQASVAAATNQAGAVNSPNSTSSYNKSHSSVGGSLGNSSTLPVVAPAISFGYPNFSANGSSPYMTIVHNNGYSFPFSTSLGATAAIRGATTPQAPHVLTGPFYSSQTFHPLQHPQQHPQSQALVQPSYLNASTSSSSSSHKQSQGAQVNGNNILTSTTMEQQSQKRQTSLSHLCKHETEIAGANAPSVANRTSYPQKNMHGQNFTMPVQPVNFSFKPSATSDTVVGNGGSFGDKQQQQALKGGIENMPSQPFAISFAAFNGTSTPSNLNFSSMAQNPVILHSLPDIAWQGYQAASIPQTTQQKTYSISEAKSGGNSSHQDDEKKITHAKSSSNGPTTLVFDNSSKNLNFVLSTTNGNWSSHSIASTAITSVPLSSNASSSQQPPHLLQLPKQQHAVQQQQPAMATRYKASSTNSTAATKFANNAPAFSQTLAPCKSSNQASHTKALAKSTDSHGHHSSIIASNTPTLKNFSQEQGRVLPAHMQISFGGNYITSLPPQGQQLLNNNQPLCTTAAGTPFSGGNVKSNSEGSKVSSSANASQLQQTENSAGSGQKSSPVCGRNVPSILSSCPSQLSELKY